ncbi:MAG: prepilin-type N-terminal cleavage/methylation domain-containing protein, partial [Polyangiales bacterium]
MARHPRSAGFTTIELLVGVAIVGILAAVAIPSFQGYVQRGRVTEAVKVLNEIKTRQEAYRSRFGNYAAVN